MRKDLLSKILVMGVIFLFIGGGVFPVTGIIINDKIIIRNQTEVESKLQNNGTSDNDEWPQFKHDPNSTGYVSSTGPETPNIKWKYYLGVLPGNAAPIIANKKVYITTSNEVFFCFNASTGKVIWQTSLPGGTSVGSAAVYEEKVYQAAVYDYVYCWNASTGELIWNYDEDYGAVRSLLIYEGKVYSSRSLDNQKGNINCLDAENGTHLWSHNFGANSYSTPCASNGKVYICASDSNGVTMIYCLDAENGDVLWTKYVYGNQGSPFTSPAVCYGKVYVGGSKLWCLNTTDGEEIWSYNFGKAIESSPSVAKGKVYVCWDKTTCLNAETGEFIWEYSYGGDNFLFSYPAVCQDKVYISKGKGFISSRSVICLDADNGSKLWEYQFPINGWACSAPSVAYGRLYICTSYPESEIFCFEDPSEPPLEPSIDGPTNGTRYVNYNYTFNTTDPELDSVSYWVDWGDSTNSGWTDYYPSGQSIILGHEWSEVGFYTITAKAKDDTGAFGNWSDPFVVNIVSIPPDPPIINGPVSGKPGRKYYYEFSAVDPEDDRIYYFVDWGDNTSSGWFGSFSSGHVVRMGHTWDEQGIYIIKVRAKDIYDAKSDWGKLIVTIPRDKATNNVLFWRLLEQFPLLQRLLDIWRLNVE